MNDEKQDPTQIVSTRLEPHEIKRLDEIAKAECRHRSQQIAHYVRLGMRASEAARRAEVGP